MTTGDTDVVRPDRQRSLDGLRGVAALIVVVFHVLRAVPGLASASDTLHADGWRWWLANTPVWLLWNGYASVLIFFVLSGFVLTVGRRRSRPDWAAYYPSRLLRLYLPAWAAVVMCLVIAEGVHEWSPVSAHGVLRDLFLVRGVDGLDLPLWSLQWELIFSLLLPLYVLFSQLRPDLWPLKLVVALVAVAIGVETRHQTLVLLPVFALGSVLAVAHERGALTFLNGPRARCALVMVTLLTLNAKSLAGVGGQPSRLVFEVVAVTETVGAGLAVCCALYIPSACRLLRAPMSQWLGTRSFSLYLVHWPVIALIAYAAGTYSVVAVVITALPLSLLLAEAFYRYVERPTHGLSRRLSAALRVRAARVPSAQSR